MEKRYQVFVSSTYEDLREERQEVMQALLELDCIPSGMELFPAANEDQWTLIKRVIDDCDYYIVIIGGRYGSKGPEGISYTQMEYEYAVKIGKPIIAFLHKDTGKLPSEKCEKESDGREKLEQFRKLAQEKVCKYWITPADLGGVVSRSIIKLIKNHPAVGWARADLIPDKNFAEELLRSKKRIEELERSLISSPTGAEQFAQGDDIIELNYKYRVYVGREWQQYEFCENKFSTTWDIIFSKISHLLIDEASETFLTEILEDFIKNNVEHILKDQTGKNDIFIEDIRITSDNFNTIIIQLLAIGLITKSKKRRSTSDSDTYWTLTPYGEAYMVSMKAIRRKKFPLPAAH